MQEILIIEDDQSFREYLELMLWNEEFCVTSAGSTHDAFEELRTNRFEAILCDLHLPFALDERILQYQYSVEVGIRTIRELQWAIPDTKIIAMTAALPGELARLNQERDFVPVLYKPFTASQVVRLLRPHYTEALTLQ